MCVCGGEGISCGTRNVAGVVGWGKSTALRQQFDLGASVVFFTLEDGTHHTGNPGGFFLISRQSGVRRSAC